MNACFPVNIKNMNINLTPSKIKQSPSESKGKTIVLKNKRDDLELVAKNNDEVKKTPLPVDSKVKFFMKWAGLDLLATVTTAIGSMTLASANICAHHYMPDQLAYHLDNITYPHHAIREILAANSIFFKMSVITPVTEELHYRLLIQELFLKQIPKKILARISPAHVSLVDSKVAKIARVVIASFLFALPHYISPEAGAHMFGTYNDPCFMGNRILNAFGTGIVFGFLQEITGNIANPIIAHMLHNSIPSLLLVASGFKL